MTNTNHLESWLNAWHLAIERAWCHGAAGMPDGVPALVRFAHGLVYVAPEMLQQQARVAWSFFEQEGDTPIGRAAVALAYILAVWGRK